MKNQMTVVAKPGSGESGRLGSRFAKLDTATRNAANRSLAQLAFVYASAYFVGFLYYWWLTIQQHGSFRPPLGQDVFFAVISIAYALFVGFRCHDGSCAVQSFADTAQRFLVVGGVGISGNLWGWEGRFEPVSTELLGVPWLGVWFLTFSNIVALTPRRFFVGSMVGVAGLIGVIYASALLHGAPPGASAGAVEMANRLAGNLAVPTLICAGIAVYCAHRVFKMAESISEARRLGSYQLTEKLGTGGMGEVWKAEHEMLVRPAAIKLIRKEVMGERDGGLYQTLVARFEREVQATAALTSPHTVQIYDFGITDGSFYYVMELLEGSDLKTLVERFGPVPASRAASFLRQACDSLYDAHESGMIHRDIKPANLFVCRRGRTYDFIKVLDFGLVKDTGMRSKESAELTMQGLVSGTPAFMAPEMATGASAIDARADIYALGCVGYWLLTGELVFPAPTPLAMLLQHARERPTPPSERIELDIPPAFDQLILQCLEKNPQDRPASARELARRLADVERECEAWTHERAERWWRAHLPHLAGSSTSVAVPVAVGV